jgi:hypothetical protein
MSRAISLPEAELHSNVGLSLPIGGGLYTADLQGLSHLLVQSQIGKLVVLLALSDEELIDREND